MHAKLASERERERERRTERPIPVRSGIETEPQHTVLRKGSQNKDA